MSMSTLYALTSDYLKLMDLGDSDDPVDQQAFLDTLEGLTGEIETKADNYAVIIDSFKNQSAAIDAEIKRLKKRKDAVDNSIDRMKDRIKEAMEAMDKLEIRTDLHTFKIQKNGGKQAMMITADVPDAYTKTIIEPDNDKIRAALESGEELPFAELLPRGTQLRIR